MKMKSITFASIFIITSLLVGFSQANERDDPEVSRAGDSRLIAYLGNWQACPSTEQISQYTHIVIAFAVSYTWSPTKNQCSTTCQIETPSICNNSPNQSILQEWQALGKKVILSFGGAGMGGSWSGDVNDCWEYCYGRENQVVEQLTGIINDLGLDGVDIDYEYFYENNQNGSGFTKGLEAQKFLTDITRGLRASLPSSSIVTHAPMDSDIVPGTAYYDILVKEASSLDFLMPQYYNGATRPIIDGIDGFGLGTMSALSHYTNLANDIFGGDATKIIFGFCISDCAGTNSNANSQQAATVMNDLKSHYNCNGGAFFWVAFHDINGSWSNTVGSVTRTTEGCSNSMSPHAKQSISPSPSPNIFLHPTSSLPTHPPTGVSTAVSNMCCGSGYTGLKAYNSCEEYYHCVNGIVTGSSIPCSPGTLFDENLQFCNWSEQVVSCSIEPCGVGRTTEPSSTIPSTVSPVASPTMTPSSNQSLHSLNPIAPCCMAGFTGLRAWNDCLQYYHCVNGVVTGDIIDVPLNTLFDQSIQNINWANMVTCVVDKCGDDNRKLRGVA